MPEMAPVLLKTDDYGPLISPKRDHSTPIYNWHAFKHSFSKGLVDGLITEFGLNKGAWVLEPFCGGGTTLLACKESGINTAGFDILPFSVFLTRTKTRTYNEVNLNRELTYFKKTYHSTDTSSELPNIGFVDKAFDPNVKRELLSLKEKIRRIHNPDVRDFFMLGLLSILESVSNTSKAGGFLRFAEKDVSPDDVYPKYISRLEQMVVDVAEFNEKLKYKDVRTRVAVSDSRKLITSRKFDAVITSPPYPNRHDYTRIYSLELIFNFVTNNKDLKDIRYNTLRSHVEARKRYAPKDYSKPELLTELITEVEANGANNPKVTEMLDGYFEDMFLSLQEMRRCLKADGKIGLVVSNVRYAGITIPVDEILSEVGEQAGLKTEAIWAARYRGNSPQQMEKYKRKPTRESIILYSLKIDT